MVKREKIIQRASEMFVEFGVKSVRMDDVAQDLAISKRTLYELFADKQELLYHSISRVMRNEAEAIRAKVDIKEKGIPALFEIFEMMVARSQVRTRIMENLQKFYPEVFERVMKENRDLGLAQLREQLLSLVELGLVDPNVNIDLAVTMFYYTSMGLIRRHSKLVLPEGVSEESAYAYMVINFFRGLATLKGVEQIDAYIREKNEKRN
jgi:AcrR family transcriptional regulator